MLSGGQCFEHWTYRLIGDVGLNAASMTLLSRLLAQGRLAFPRARLYRPGGQAGLRQALLLDFGVPVVLTGQSGAYLGLWLVEQADRKVFCHGVERPSGRMAIGGRMLHQLAALDPGARWVSALAEQLAAQKLVASSSARAAPDRPSERWILGQVEHALLMDALTRFCAELDPEVLAAVRTEARVMPAIFNAYCSTEGSERRNRLQAAQAFPWFSDALREDWRLRRSVAQGKPLAQALATRFQVKPRSIAHTRELSPPPATLSARMTLLKRLDALPPEYQPRNEPAWAQHLALSERLGDLAGALGVEPLQLLKPFRPGWQAGLTALERQSGAPLDLDAIFEMMQAAYHYGVRPALMAWQVEAGLPAVDLPRRPPASFYPLWFGRYGLGRLASLAQRWRQSIARFSLVRLEVDPETCEPLTWPALLPSAHTRGAYRILELTSQGALEQEGHRLGHCVGTYVAACLDQGCAIYSIRDRLGQSLSTFEVRLTEAGPLLIQHKAFGNAEPQAAEQALVARYVEQVLAPVPAARVMAVCEERRAIAAGAVALIERLDALEENGELMGEVQDDIADGLARLTDALHPSEAQRDGLPVFLFRQGAAVLRELGMGQALSNA